MPQAAFIVLALALAPAVLAQAYPERPLRFIVLTGRGGDCSLFLAPMIHEFGWRQDDWDLLGKGQTGADMVECGANVSGGFFADPGYKEVPELWNLGYPLLEVEADGTIVVSKLPGTGGVINRAICVEQMIYEIHDPANYITDRKSTRLNSSHVSESRMPSSA